MRTILLFILLLSNGLLAAQTNVLQKTDTAKSPDKHVIDPEANEKALAEIRRKTEQRQEKILKKYKGKKAHLKKSDTTVKAEEVIVPVSTPTEK